MKGHKLNEIREKLSGKRARQAEYILAITLVLAIIAAGIKLNISTFADDDAPVMIPMGVMPAEGQAGVNSADGSMPEGSGQDTEEGKDGETADSGNSSNEAPPSDGGEQEQPPAEGSGQGQGSPEGGEQQPQAPAEGDNGMPQTPSGNQSMEGGAESGLPAVPGQLDIGSPSSNDAPAEGTEQSGAEGSVTEEAKAAEDEKENGSSVQSAETEAAGEEERPAFSESQTIGGVTVSVEAEEGVFPKGAKLYFRAVTPTEAAAVDAGVG